jgi:hypothetical protein
MMRFTLPGTVLAAVTAVAVAAAAGARTIYHCNQATQHCVNGSLPYNVNSQPPNAADRRGLLRAFDRAHPNRSNIALVGFRVDSPHSAAGYYLITGPDHSTYLAAHTDFFHRTGPHSWVHVKRLKKVTPGWSDAYNLGPGFLWKATGDGSGTFAYQDSTIADDGSGETWTYSTQANFTWNFNFAGGHVLKLGDGSANAAPSLTGQITAGTTDSLDPTNDASCSGPVNDTHSGVSLPSMSFAEYPHEGKTQALDFTVFLADQLSVPSSCSSDWATFPESGRFVVGARVPIDVFERNGFFTVGGLSAPQLLSAEPFDVPVDDQAPTAVRDAQPHQAGTTDDGTAKSTYTEDLRLAGRLHFKLVGLWMPLGWLGTPHAPLKADGKVPPVL